MKLSYYILLTLAVTLTTQSCRSPKSEFDAATYIERFNRYCRQGNFDSLALSAGEVFENREEISDERLVAIATLNLAQAAVSMDDFPLAKKYCDELDSNTFILSDYKLLAMFCGIKAMYEVKSGFNYPQALVYFTDALNYYKRVGDDLNTCTALNNISMIYFFRRDTTGISYAREALELSLSSGKEPNPYMTCMSYVTLSMMLMLKEEYDGAEHYALMSKEIADEYGYSIVYSRLYMVLGEVALHNGDLKVAEDYLNKGMEYAKLSDKDFYYEISLSYARLLISLSKYGEAEVFLKDVLEDLTTTGNVRYKYPILDLLSEVYSLKGDVDSSYRYYRMGVVSKDSLLGIGKETAFNDLLALYEKTSLENVIQRKQKNMNVIIFICILSVLIGLSFYLRYRMQNRSYKELVEKHQKYLQRNEMMRRYMVPKGDSQGQKQSSDEELFERLETLMQQEHAYRQNEISLDKIAAMLGTNRTYISRTINHYAKKSFYGYINMYRIDEAAKILSNPDDTIQIKNLYEFLGYNSATAFYRVFRSEVGCSPAKYREEVMRMSSSKKSLNVETLQ